jgi:hypothetical protein
MFTPEGITKDAMKKLLDSYGDELYYFFPVQSGYGERLVDTYICFRGLFIAVEAKRPGAKARKFQARIMDRIRDANGETLCIDKIDELKTLLDYIARHEIKLAERPPLKRRPDAPCGTTRNITS